MNDPIRVLKTAAMPLLWASMAGFAAGSAHAETLSSDWVEGFNNKVRLLAGAAGAPKTPYAGVEISMPAGWKTYWQAPGEAGGIAPEFDWTGSVNLKEARVRFPVPHRLVDKAGAAIGYKDHVVFPVSVKAEDPGKPVDLKLKVAYGACKDICIPAEAELALTLPPDASESTDLAEALTRVPGDAGERDPKLSAWRIDEQGKPKLVLEVADPGGSGGDAFLSGPESLYLPLPKKVSDDAGKAVYEVDLTDGVDLKDLKDKVITVTLSGVTGQSAYPIRIPK